MIATIEQDVKQVLLEELGALSYAEKRKVRDGLDAKYIDAELKKLENRKKYPIIMGLFQAALIVQALGMFFSIQSKTVLCIRIVAGLIGAFMAGIELGRWEKRRLIYRVFSRLAAIKPSLGITS